MLFATRTEASGRTLGFTVPGFSPERGVVYVFDGESLLTTWPPLRLTKFSSSASLLELGLEVPTPDRPLPERGIELPPAPRPRGP